VDGRILTAPGAPETPIEPVPRANRSFDCMAMFARGDPSPFAASMAGKAPLLLTGGRDPCLRGGGERRALAPDSSASRNGGFGPAAVRQRERGPRLLSDALSRCDHRGRGRWTRLLQDWSGRKAAELLPLGCGSRRHDHAEERVSRDVRCRVLLGCTRNGRRRVRPDRGNSSRFLPQSSPDGSPHLTPGRPGLPRS